MRNISTDYLDNLTQDFTNMPTLGMLGMFEMFGAHPNRQAETEALISWLNQNTPSEIREIYQNFGVTF